MFNAACFPPGGGSNMSSQSASPASSLNMSTGAFRRHEHLLPEVDSDEEALIKVELDIIKPTADDGKPQGKTMHVANVLFNSFHFVGKSLWICQDFI